MIVTWNNCRLSGLGNETVIFWGRCNSDISVQKKGSLIPLSMCNKTQWTKKIPSGKKGMSPFYQKENLKKNKYGAKPFWIRNSDAEKGFEGGWSIFDKLLTEGKDEEEPDLTKVLSTDEEETFDLALSACNLNIFVYWIVINDL